MRSEFGRIDTWLRRNESPEATTKCKAEFTIKNVRLAAAELHRLYERLIDYGAHPNQRGVFTAVRLHESTSQVDFKVGILYPAEL